LISPVDKISFQGSIRRLRSQFVVYAGTSPEPLPAPGLVITPEIRLQSELYLPISNITSVFNRLFSAALTYPPIFSSTPFHTAMSWADCFSALPPQVQFSEDPARLLESLLDDHALLTRFLFASFLPDRFYGGSQRYPEQQNVISTWLETRRTVPIRCLDAACGTGEDTYGLAHLLSAYGYSRDDIQLEGWTLEPLEVWAATERCFPHDLPRESAFRESTAWLSERDAKKIIRFRCQDLIKPVSATPFDLIICNGLLGGPIMHRREEVDRIVTNLACLLAPGGILLAANRFHGGWKQHCPQAELQAVFEGHGLASVIAGEGISGHKTRC
jgi:chemotaxis methyl-accepting protein methylase